MEEPGRHGSEPPQTRDDRWSQAMPATKKHRRREPQKVLHLTTYYRLEGSDNHWNRNSG